MIAYNKNTIQYERRVYVDSKGEWWA